MNHAIFDIALGIAHTNRLRLHSLPLYSHIALYFLIALCLIVPVVGSAQIDNLQTGSSPTNNSPINNSPTNNMETTHDLTAEQAINQAQSGELYIKQDKKNAVQATTLLGMEADINVSGMNASVKVTQTFSNNSDQWGEALYIFPLPPNSAVHAMTMVINDRVIQGRIEEKEAAKAEYKAAKAAGKKVALTTQQRPNMFTQRVANIPPRASISVELLYTQSVRYDLGKFHLRFPSTITPRYIPGTPIFSRSMTKLENETQPITEHPFNEISETFGWGFPTTAVPDAHEITPFYLQQTVGENGSQSIKNNSLKINIELNAGLALADIVSPSHPLTRINRNPDREDTKIKFNSVLTHANRDFELTWVHQSSHRPTHAVFHDVTHSLDTMDNNSFIQLMLLPPQTKDTHNAEINDILPRDIIFIIDTSGSMDGPSIIQAKNSLDTALLKLKPQDTFNIIEFNSQFSTFRPTSISASRRNIDSARHFIKKLYASGGTEMAPALRAALATQAPEGILKQVIFMTDGAVGNEQALFKIIHEKLGNARLFTIGIGSAPNSYFMRDAAKFGRGTHTHISDIKQVQSKMQELFAKLDSPVAANIQLDWPRHVTVEYYPQKVPDLYLGEPLLVYAKTTPALSPNDDIVISGYNTQGPWTKTLKAGKIKTHSTTYSTTHSATRSTTQPTDHTSAIATRWAREKITTLLDEKIRGGDEALIRESVLDVALSFRLLSPYTAFIAVDDEPSRPAHAPLQNTPVPNTPPKGQNISPSMYANTATPSALYIIIGFILSFAGILRWRFQS